MMVVGTLVFSLAVLVYSIVGVNKRTDFSSVNRFSNLRILVRSAAELPNVHIMHKNGAILPVADDLNVVATVDKIIGWDDSGIVRPIYNAQRHIIVRNIGSPSIQPISFEKARYLGVLSPSPSSSPVTRLRLQHVIDAHKTNTSQRQTPI
ncbi:uncharacterized protein LOC117172139 [Belonocnema kinseyi]|uniref:uncharacterized protein LOC117172139 n=1 Tax=Belonocnema kinseyi TaxID=2817044 RepID=UPI00143DC98D|nr:uncharacterized protein LOC117172139 [Belonocnema kinseyi]